MDLERSLTPIDDDHHDLLEPAMPAYSDTTIRRSFVAWLHCGKTNKFQQICNYYHCLEAMEDNLPANDRAHSRHHESDLLCNEPPKSMYLNEMFPQLYSHSHIDKERIKAVESITNEKCVFKLEGFKEIANNKRCMLETADTCRMIRKYCKSNSMPLRTFLNKFTENARKCELSCTVENIARYITKKLLQDEIEIVNNCPKSFSFLETNEEVEVSTSPSEEDEKSKSPVFDEYYIEDNNANYRKLNRNCAEFFKFFNDKQIESFKNDKSVSCSLVDSYSFNVISKKLKSRSAESLFENGKMNIKGFDNSLLNSLMSFNEVMKLRRICNN